MPLTRTSTRTNSPSIGTIRSMGIWSRDRIRAAEMRCGKIIYVLGQGYVQVS